MMSTVCTRSRKSAVESKEIRWTQGTRERGSVRGVLAKLSGRTKEKRGTNGKGD